MTLQDQMKDKLGQLGIPHRKINCYGGQVTVECHSRRACERFAVVIAKFATIKNLIETHVEAKENKGSVLCPTMIKVWRLYARIY